MGDTIGFRHVKAARKAARCSYCGEAVEKGQPCNTWLWAERGNACDCRMHPECYDAHCDSGDEEFVLYCNERPSAVVASATGKEREP